MGIYYYYKLSCILTGFNWGSVPDWIMVLVTALTAVFLWKTLKSQQSVQEMQQRITNLEVKKQKREIEPFFEAKVFKTDIQAREDPKEILEHAVLWQVAFEFKNTSKNTAYNISISAKSEGWRRKGSRTIQQAAPGEPCIIQLEGFYQTKRKSFDDKAAIYNCFGPDLVLELNFTDFRHEPYRQRFDYSVKVQNKPLYGHGVEELSKDEWKQVIGY